MTSTLEHQPELIPQLGGVGGISRRSADEYDRQVSTLLYRREDEDVESMRKALARFVAAERMRIAVRSLLDVDDEVETGIDLTLLAESTLGAAMAIAAPRVPIAAIGIGKLGGTELGLSSDLDVVFVHGGSTEQDIEEASRVAEVVVKMLNGSTPAQQIWALDVDLRPEGKNGALIPSLAAARHYYLEGRAETWERQAMTRARVVAGDQHVGEVAMRLLEEFVWKSVFDDGHAREIRRMKARVEAERIPTGEDPQFHLKLGRGSQSDVEWTVQLLLMRHGIRATGTR
jgi:glutamate-ammonia-ligase adenylyltransferase